MKNSWAERLWKISLLFHKIRIIFIELHKERMDQNVEEKSGNGMKLRAPVGWTIAIAHVMSNVVNFILAELCFPSRFYRTEIFEKNMEKRKCSTFINFYLRDDLSVYL